MTKMKILYSLFLACALSQAQKPFVIDRTIPLNSVSGKFDHLAIDTVRERLFVAATGNHSVEVVNLKTNKIEQSISGLGKPHGLVWVDASSSLYVADGALAELRVYKGNPLALAATIKLSDDADDMVYDQAHHLLFVGHGTGEEAAPAKIAVVDTEHFTLVANLAVSSHPEALEIDANSNRVFANIAGSSEVAIIDTATRTITALWKMNKVADNVPLAFDEKHQLLYVACREPGTVLALDASSGKEIARQSAAGGVDDLFYDATLSRIYLISGEGEVDSYRLDESKSLHELDVLHTAASAKTGLFVPSQHRLYIAVPGAAGHAEIRVFATTPAEGK